MSTAEMYQRHDRSIHESMAVLEVIRASQDELRLQMARSAAELTAAHQTGEQATRALVEYRKCLLQPV